MELTDADLVLICQYQKLPHNRTLDEIELRGILDNFQAAGAFKAYNYEWLQAFVDFFSLHPCEELIDFLFVAYPESKKAIQEQVKNKGKGAPFVSSLVWSAKSRKDLYDFKNWSKALSATYPKSENVCKSCHRIHKALSKIRFRPVDQSLLSGAEFDDQASDSDDPSSASPDPSSESSSDELQLQETKPSKKRKHADTQSEPTKNAKKSAARRAADAAPPSKRAKTVEVAVSSPGPKSSSSKKTASAKTKKNQQPAPTSTRGAAKRASQILLDISTHDDSDHDDDVLSASEESELKSTPTSSPSSCSQCICFSAPAKPKITTTTDVFNYGCCRAKDHQKTWNNLINDFEKQVIAVGKLLIARWFERCKFHVAENKAKQGNRGVEEMKAAKGQNTSNYFYLGGLASRTSSFSSLSSRASPSTPTTSASKVR